MDDPFGELDGFPSDAELPAEDADRSGLWLSPASGTDPDEPDPGCRHLWRDLGFTDDGEALVCWRCDAVWAFDGNAGDAVLTVWSAARGGMADMQRQLDRLADFVAANTDSARCAWCGTWTGDPDDLVEVDDQRVCGEHLGQFAARTAPFSSDQADRVAVTLVGFLTADPASLHWSWLADKAAVECPEVVADELDADLLGLRMVDLSPSLAQLLGLPETVDVSAVVAAVAAVLDLPAPASRAGRALLLGLAAQTDWAFQYPELLTGDVLAALFAETVPSQNRDRATVVLDLYRTTMPPNATVSGEMADETVEALVQRAAAEFTAHLPS